MGHAGLLSLSKGRSVVRLAATVVAAAAVARAADSARRLLDRICVEPPRHRALTTSSSAVPLTLTPSVGLAANHGPAVVAASDHHAFGPTPSVVASHGIGFRTEPVTAASLSMSASDEGPGDSTDDELEASGELDDGDGGPTAVEAPASAVDEPAEESVPGPIDRLLSRRKGPSPPTATPSEPERVSARDEPAPAPPRPKSTSPKTPAAPRTSDHALGEVNVEIVSDDDSPVAVDLTVDDPSPEDATSQAVVEVEVTHRETGKPASGKLVLSTELIDVTVPLVDGRASVTIRLR